MTGFALKGAIRYLREEYGEGEIESIQEICTSITSDLSKRKGYLHPRALAAASSHIYNSRRGTTVTLEHTSSKFRISTATLREYLRAYKVKENIDDTLGNIIERVMNNPDTSRIVEVCKRLKNDMNQRSMVNSRALAAAGTYLYYYNSGKRVSLTQIARRYRVSVSTIREYINMTDAETDKVGRAKILVSRYPGVSDKDAVHKVLERIENESEIGTARILAALAVYIYKIEQQEYVAIESVARVFNVSVPALRSYIMPYVQDIKDRMLLYKKGDAKDPGSFIAKMNESEKEMLELIYSNYDLDTFAIMDLFSIRGVPKGRWQLFIRKMMKAGLIDVYKKPLDSKQYFSLVGGMKNYLEKPRKLDKWIN